MNTLATPKYIEELRAMHAREPWGTKGARHIRNILPWYYDLQCSSILDYGSGAETLRIELGGLDPPIDVQCYDLGVPGREVAEPADFVVCTDVLEHIEPELVENVLQHISSLGRKGAFFNIALTPAKRFLPDGRNAHILLKPGVWWHEQIVKSGWEVREEKIGKKSMQLWLKKPAS